MSFGPHHHSNGHTFLFRVRVLSARVSIRVSLPARSRSFCRGIERVFVNLHVHISVHLSISCVGEQRDGKPQPDDWPVSRLVCKVQTILESEGYPTSIRAMFTTGAYPLHPETAVILPPETKLNDQKRVCDHG